jgi:hypothetical protein
MFMKKKREFFFFCTETKRKRHERIREIKRTEGRDPKVAVQGRRRCNPSSLISFLFDSNHAQQRK